MNLFAVLKHDILPSDIDNDISLCYNNFAKGEKNLNIFELLETKTETLVPVEFYFKSFDENFSMQYHFHENFEFMYAESGYFTVATTEDEETHMYHVKEGCFILIPSMIPHKLVVTKPVKICNLEFKKIALPPDCKLKLFPILNTFDSYKQMKKGGQAIIVLNDTENLLNTMTIIHQILKIRLDTIERFYQLQALTLNLFIDVGNCYLNSKYSVDNLYIYKILRIIHKDLSANLTPKIIADTVKISESYLFRIFKKKMNCTITYYVNQIRVEKAKQLLVNTAHPVIDISMEVGFNSRQYFCKIFSSFTGLSPAEYRKKQKKSEYTIALQDKIQTFLEE